MEIINEAETFLYHDNILLDTLTRQEEAYFNNGKLLYYTFYYRSSLIKPGYMYKLKIKVEGFDTISAQAKPLDTVGIKFIDGNYLYSRDGKNYYQISFFINDPKTERNFYELYCSGHNQYKQSNVYLPTKEDEQTSNISFNDSKLENNLLKLILIEDAYSGRADTVFFKCWQSDTFSEIVGSLAKYQREMNETNQFYAFEPINVYSNVTNGYGNFFGTSNAVYDTINLLELFPDVK